MRLCPRIAPGWPGASCSGRRGSATPSDRWSEECSRVPAARLADRAGLAGGRVLGTAGIGNAVGPLVGGVLTDAASWRWILLINVPIGAFAVLVTLRHVKAD